MLPSTTDTEVNVERRVAEHWVWFGPVMSLDKMNDPDLVLSDNAANALVVGLLRGPRGYMPEPYRSPTDYLLAR